QQRQPIPACSHLNLLHEQIWNRGAPSLNQWSPRVAHSNGPRLSSRSRRSAESDRETAGTGAGLGPGAASGRTALTALRAAGRICRLSRNTSTSALRTRYALPTLAARRCPRALSRSTVG